MGPHDILLGPVSVTVVIPACNAAHTLPRCLAAVHDSGSDNVEVLVVDDGSVDRTAELAIAHGAAVVRLDTPSGPAVARNAGVNATEADVVLFVDADVVIAPDVIPRVVTAFETDPELSAMFGSYDAKPAAGTLVSDYRNLLHHFTHQASREDSQTFWAGCGAVRKSVFVELGGFDERYGRPSIEDIEFGYRCANARHRVRLEKHLLCTHLKRWTLPEIVRVDIRDRAYPWARLALAHGDLPVDLNLRWSHRVSGILVWLAPLSLVIELVMPGWRGLSLATCAVMLGVVAWLNRSFYRWLARCRGVWFLARAFWLHLLYYGYSSATFGWAWVRHHMTRMFTRV